MSDDLNKKVQQIAQMLGKDDVPDNVKELVAMIAASLKGDSPPDGDGPDGDSPGRDSPLPQKLPVQDCPEAENSGSTTALNDEAIDSAKNVLRQINSVNDPRINLLNAIKPFMNSKRQRKISSCIQLLQIAGLSRMLNEKEK